MKDEPSNGSGRCWECGKRVPPEYFYCSERCEKIVELRARGYDV